MMMTVNYYELGSLKEELYKITDEPSLADELFNQLVRYKDSEVIIKNQFKSQILKIEQDYSRLSENDKYQNKNLFIQERNKADISYYSKWKSFKTEILESFDKKLQFSTSKSKHKIKGILLRILHAL